VLPVTADLSLRGDRLRAKKDNAIIRNTKACRQAENRYDVHVAKPMRNRSAATEQRRARGEPLEVG
jgi:hypothetical protein